MMKRLTAVFLAAMMALSVAGCGSPAPAEPAMAPEAAEKTEAATETPAPPKEADAPAKDALVLQVACENSMSEPVGQALLKWQQLVEEKGDGSLKLEIFPDSQLGSKNDLIDSMLLGEKVITLADGAFFAEYGAPDLGIVVGPFMFDSWEQCWTLIESDWYMEQEAIMEAKGLKLLTSNWIYGARHTMTTKPVTKVEDLKGLKIRTPQNKIQSYGADVLGATSTGMALGDVYSALQSGTIDGVENPLATLYGRKLQEVAKYLILDGHIKMFSTWLCSADVFNSLTPEQQEILVSSGKEAGIYNNDLQQKSDAEYLQMMKDEGVTVTELTPETEKGFVEASLPFYEMGETFGWSEGLYDRVKAIIG